MKFTFLIVIFYLEVNSSNGARILAIFPTPSISHQIVYRSLMEALVKRGHVITLVTPDPVNYTDPMYKNLTQIDFHDISYKEYNESFNFVESAFQETPRRVVQRYYNMLLKVCEAQYSSPEFQRLIHNNEEHYDVIFNEGIIPVSSAFKKRYNAPLILITSIGLAPNHFSTFGNPTHPALYPDTFSTYDSHNIWLWQKIYLVYRHYMYVAFYNFLYLPTFNMLTKQYFGEDTQSIDEIEREADLLLVNYNPVWHGVQPFVPSIVGFTSMHIKPAKPLPEHLQKYLDNASEGVIYFSFGSNIQATQLPESKRRIFLQVFKSLPYKVIWKWEDENLPGKPDNVFISKWLPQVDILAHPNIKVFITQGGQQSVEESIDRRVPMLAIPFVFDQEANAHRVEKHGIGRSLPLETLNEKDLKDVLQDVATNPRYRENVAKLRELFNDQPQSSLEKAVWWTEYVIRHNGTKHLRSPAVGLPFYTYHMLDVLLIVVILIGFIVYSIRKLMHFFTKFQITLKIDQVKKIS